MTETKPWAAERANIVEDCAKEARSLGYDKGKRPEVDPIMKQELDNAKTKRMAYLREVEKTASQADLSSAYGQTSGYIAPYRSSCPSCGYCGHCGRGGGYYNRPYWGGGLQLQMRDTTTTGGGCQSIY